MKTPVALFEFFDAVIPFSSDKYVCYYLYDYCMNNNISKRVKDIMDNIWALAEQ